MYEINQQQTLAFYTPDASGDPVTGLVKGDFTVNLYDPSGVLQDSSFYNITERGNGHYNFILTPDEVGSWSVRITCSASGAILNLFRDFVVGGMVQTILGLEGQNQYIDNMTYHATFRKVTGCRIRIYDDSANVGTGTGVLATYTMTATYNTTTGKLETYKLLLS